VIKKENSYLVLHREKLIKLRAGTEPMMNSLSPLDGRRGGSKNAKADAMNLKNLMCIKFYSKDERKMICDYLGKDAAKIFHFYDSDVDKLFNELKDYGNFYCLALFSEDSTHFIVSRSQIEINKWFEGLKHWCIIPDGVLNLR
jgi:hypothetical protein